MREKYDSEWKNKLKNTYYKTSEGHIAVKG
jgi:hypothetical protein